MKISLTIALIALSLIVKGQSNTWEGLTLQGYLEAYYAAPLHRTSDNNKPGFLYSHRRLYEPAVNLAFVSASYKTDQVRANIKWAAGTYMNDNYAAEPAGWKNIYEMNTGIRLSKQTGAAWWLDVGILPSHIGWESAVSKDCPTLTRSIAAENSPYYETGARLSYTSSNGKLYLAALVLNGWQTIHRTSTSPWPSLGTQVTWQASPALSLNSSTYLGVETPDGLQRIRYFHDGYAVYSPTQELHLTVGLDIGAQQRTPEPGKLSTWYSPVAILQLAFNTRLAASFKGEYYSDADGVILSRGMSLWGLSTELQYKMSDHALWRVEARHIRSDGALQNDRAGKEISANAFVTTSLAISF